MQSPMAEKEETVLAEESPCPVPPVARERAPPRIARRAKGAAERHPRS